MKKAIWIISMFHIFLFVMMADFSYCEEQGNPELILQGYTSIGELSGKTPKGYIGSYNNYIFVPKWSGNDPQISVEIYNYTDELNFELKSIYQSSERGLTPFERKPIQKMDIKYPYLFLPYNQGFEVIDITNISDPVLVGVYRVEKPGDGIIAIRENNALFYHDNGLDCIDLSNSQSPKLINQIAIQGQIRDLIWDEENIAYLLFEGIQEGHIQIVNLNRFNNPTIVSNLSLPINRQTVGAINLYGFVKIDQRIYLPTVNVGLYVVDIHNNQMPFLEKTMEGDYREKQFIRKGNYLIAYADEWISVFKILPSGLQRIHQFEKKCLAVAPDGFNRFFSLEGYYTLNNYELILPSFTDYFISTEKTLSFGQGQKTLVLPFEGLEVIYSLAELPPHLQPRSKS